MSHSQKFFDQSAALLSKARAANAPILQRLAPVIGHSVAVGGVLHVFGSGHSDVIAREIIGRAGGLACVNGIIDPTGGFVENVVGYGTKLVERHDRQYQLLPGETIIVISNSGKNSSPIEVALYAKKKGLTVAALTSVAMSTVAATVHPDGRKLHEIADFVLDNGGVPGDTLIDVTPAIPRSSDPKIGPPLMSGPTSTFIGSMLLNLLMLDVIEWLQINGHPVPLLRSQNMANAIEHNREVGKRYAHRLSRPLA